MDEYSVYVGLNDKVTGKQLFDTEKYMALLKKVCLIYAVPFSVTRMQGSYFHKDGHYVDENTLCLSFIDINAETVNALATDLCTFFRQESVLVVRGSVETYYVHGVELDGVDTAAPKAEEIK